MFRLCTLIKRMMSGNTSWSDHIDSLRINLVSGYGFPNVKDRRKAFAILNLTGLPCGLLTNRQ
jgi:hypothetical protein